jgi:hypothetical protein
MAPVDGESGSQNASEVRSFAPAPPSVTPLGGVRTGTAVSRGLAVGTGVVVAEGTDDDEGVGVELDVADGSGVDGATVADGAGEGRSKGSRSVEINTRATTAITKATTMAAPSLRFMTQPYLCSIQLLKVETVRFTLARSRAGM